MENKVKVVIAQLGSPDSTKVSDVRRYLKEFLADPRVVDIPRILWLPILYLFVLPFRPKKSAKAYARIWSAQGFPLIENTKRFTQRLAKSLKGNVEVNHCFLLSPPRVEDLFSQWDQEDPYTRAQKVLLLPQFPQYAESTIGSVIDVTAKSLAKRVNIPQLHFIPHYHRSKAFIDNSARLIENKLKDSGIEHLILSFHGIPLRRVLEKKDEYYRHCVETFILIGRKLPDDLKLHLCFQSRFGSEQWLGPATDEYAVDLVRKESLTKLACYCPSFVVDCLETTDEIGHELADDLAVEGAELTFIECLNDDQQWVDDYAQFVQCLIDGSRQQIEEQSYQLEKYEVESLMPVQKYQNPPLSPHAKTVMKVVFLTLFIDLMGFSIIFPMFPSLAQYYLENDPANGILKGIFSTIESLMLWGGEGAYKLNRIVLFGGVVGAIYSFLQFLSAPFWGSLSDRIGRKPVMLISLTGLFISYIIWFFSGSFTLLMLSRVMGGVMAGNIATATAIVADVTQKENRSRGMAFVGIAFALGFIFGPAIGGLLSQINLLDFSYGLRAIGVNPFSIPAAFAAFLTFINIIFVVKKLPETKKEDTRTELVRTSNPLQLFKPLPIRNVNYTNFSYFFFLLAFSGMEFTLTFLASQRLGFDPVDNGKMFVFIGVLIALTQGGYVRRKASIVGEKKMATQGLVLLIPGLLLVGYAANSFILYCGLFFLAIGSAMVVPCLSALVSIHSPAELQGKSLGIFRSLGALSRVIGPIIASLIYWRYGATTPYVLGAIFLVLPLLLLMPVDKSSKAQ